MMIVNPFLPSFESGLHIPIRNNEATKDFIFTRDWKVC